tara:strand:+ start:204 stop:1025 length:822 start_codon:yes stop_codon:yes gene_type:complete
MAKAFSLASWNVEHFKNSGSRVSHIVDFLIDPSGGNKPDVFALYEVEGKSVFSALVDRMANYTFHITEGPQTQEILVGVRNTLTAFFTQKVEFKRGNERLRPGALLTLRVSGVDYSLLFLHTKSGPNPEGFGLRDSMSDRAVKFRHKLEKSAKLPKNTSNYMFLGDLNTMGMVYPYDQDIHPDLELRRLDSRAKRAQMTRLDKSNVTWWNGSQGNYAPSDLDHVVASNQIHFKNFAGHPVHVRGWVEKTTDAEKDAWIKKYSDHCLLYMEVQK